jgi:choline dehydrogenase-like flavoprotein
MQATGMNPTHLTAFLSDVWLPGMSSYASRVRASAQALQSMPWWVRGVFVAACYVLCAVAWVFKGSHTYEASLVRCTEHMLHSKVPLVRGVAMWFKTSACLIGFAEKESLQRPSYSLSHFEACPENLHTDDEADVVVVGSGPAGAMAAYILQQQGLQVLMLEEGKEGPRDWAAPHTLGLVGQRFRSAATTTTVGASPIAVLQGIGLGGSSLVNAAISWRAPESVFAQWHSQDPGLLQKFSLKRIEEAYLSVDRCMPSVETSLHTGARNNVLMAQASADLGWEAQPTRRYTEGCEGLGRCMEGCPKGHKQSTLLSLIPQARAMGMRVLTQAQVSSVVMKEGRAVGVKARVCGRDVWVHAKKAVLLGCSAVQTPLLLKRSGIRHPLLGHRFQAHPGVSMAGVFETPVREPLGAMQGYDVSHFRDSHRFKLESLTLPDALLATRFPGIGPSLSNQCAQLPHLALWASLMRTHAHGYVGGTHAMPLIRYSFTPRDEQMLLHTLKALATLFFQAGAKEVIPGVAGFDASITHPKQLDALGESLSSSRVAMIISHMFGSAVMGSEPAHAVCDPMGQVHGVNGLYVVDSSLFPTSIGVNPQHTMMAVATHVAWGLVGHTA